MEARGTAHVDDWLTCPLLRAGELCCRHLAHMSLRHVGVAGAKYSHRATLVHFPVGHMYIKGLSGLLTLARRNCIEKLKWADHLSMVYGVSYFLFWQGRMI